MSSRSSKLIVLCLLSATLFGCTLPVENPSDQYKPVKFWGYTIGPNRPISLECTTTYYPFAPEDTPISMGTIYSTDETLTQAGETAYYFEHIAVIPQECWLDPSNGSLDLMAWVRMKDVASGEEHEHFTVDGYQCLVYEYFSGTGPISAYETCRAELGNTTGWTYVSTPN